LCPSRHIAPLRDLRRFWSEADIDGFAGKVGDRAEFELGNDPSSGRERAENLRLI
jgi:hypothetical protein